MGEPTSSLPSGVIVAALIPKPALAHRAGGLVDDRVGRRAPVLQREVVALQLELQPTTSGSRTRRACSSSSWPVSSPSRTVMRQGFGHAGRGVRSPGGRAMASVCSWCGNDVDRDEGFRAAEPEGEQRAAFCRLEHVVPWVIQGAALGAGAHRRRRQRRRARPLRAVRRGRGRHAASCSSATAASTASPTRSARSTTCSTGQSAAGAGARRARRPRRAAAAARTEAAAQRAARAAIAAPSALRVGDGAAERRRRAAIPTTRRHLSQREGLGQRARPARRCRASSLRAAISGRDAPAPANGASTNSAGMPGASSERREGRAAAGRVERDEARRRAGVVAHHAVGDPPDQRAQRPDREQHARPSAASPSVVGEGGQRDLEGAEATMPDRRRTRGRACAAPESPARRRRSPAPAPRRRQVRERRPSANRSVPDERERGGRAAAPPPASASRDGQRGEQRPGDEDRSRSSTASRAKAVRCRPARGEQPRPQRRAARADAAASRAPARNATSARTPVGASGRARARRGRRAPTTCRGRRGGGPASARGGR